MLRPALFHHPLAAMGFDVDSQDDFQHDWLEITEVEFQELAGALEKFWIAFPGVMTVDHGIIASTGE
jgi:hypothetical protein